MEFIDTHAHLSYFSKEELPSILEKAQKVGISHILNICTDIDSLKRGFEIAKEYSWIKTAGATPPQDVKKKEDFRPFISKLQAVGETGLDFSRPCNKEEQIKVFLDFVSLAKENSLPLIIHCREAFRELFDLLKEDLRIVLHCFTGTKEDAKEAVMRGWFLSFSGIVTFKNSHLQEVVKDVPIENLLIETDCPYLAPHPFRGKRNEPSYLIETAKKIAFQKGISLEELAKETTKNARSLFSF